MFLYAFMMYFPFWLFTDFTDKWCWGNSSLSNCFIFTLLSRSHLDAKDHNFTRASKCTFFIVCITWLTFVCCNVVRFLLYILHHIILFKFFVTIETPHHTDYYILYILGLCLRKWSLRITKTYLKCTFYFEILCSVLTYIRTSLDFMSKYTLFLDLHFCCFKRDSFSLNDLLTFFWLFFHVQVAPRMFKKITT